MYNVRQKKLPLVFLSFVLFNCSTNNNNDKNFQNQTLYQETSIKLVEEPKTKNPEENIPKSKEKHDKSSKEESQSKLNKFNNFATVLIEELDNNTTIEDKESELGPLNNLSEDTINEIIKNEKKLKIIDEESNFSEKKLGNEPNKETKNKALVATLKMLSKPKQKEIQNESNFSKTVTKHKPQINNEVNNDILQVALLIPLSGDKARLGENILKGVELAHFDNPIKRIEIEVFDTSGNIINVFKRVIELEKDLVLGPLFSKEVKRLKNHYNNFKFPLLTFSNDSKIQFQNVWVIGNLPDNEVKEIIRFGISTGLKRVAILGTQTEYGSLLAQVAKKELEIIGGPNKTTLLKTEEVEDLNILRNKIKSFSGWKKNNDEKTKLPEPKYDAIFFAGNENFVLKTAPLLAYYDLGPDRLMFLGTSQISTQNHLLEPSLDGAFFASPLRLKRAKFIEKWKNIWGGKPPVFSDLGYDSVHLSSVLAEQDNIQNYLIRKEGHDWITGKIWLNNKGLNNREIVIYRIKDNSAEIVSDR